MKHVALFVMGLSVLVSGCVTSDLVVEEKDEDEVIFSFVTIGDTRADLPIVQPKAFFDCIQQINRLRPAPVFVVDVGDLILGYEDTTEMINKEWNGFDRAAKRIKSPFHLVVGNHDVWDEQSLAIFKERYGDTYYSFDHENSHFIVLSSEEMGKEARSPASNLSG